MRKRVPITLVLILINALAFLLQRSVSGLTNALLLDSSTVWSHPYTLITSMFMHANGTHILFNMYSLFIFGPLIEQRVGSRRFTYLYFAAGLLASIISTFFYDKALGASGAIMGVIGMTIILLPKLKVLLFFFIPMSMRTAGIIFALIDLFGAFSGYGNTANIAHLVGLAVGLSYGYYLIRKRKEHQRRFTQKPKKRSVRRSTIMLDDDDIDDFLKHGRL